MIDAEQQTHWCREQLGMLGQPVAVGEWLDDLRTRARDMLGQQPLLDRKSEGWRYSRADKVLQQNYALPEGRALDPTRLAELDVPEVDGYRLVFLNGYFQPALSRLDDLPSGVKLGSLHAALDDDAQRLAPWLGRIAAGSDNLFTALNTGWIDNGLLLQVEHGVQLDKPVQVVHVSDGGAGAALSQPRHLVVLEPGASATLVEHYVGSGGYFLNHLAEISLAQDAELRHYRIQQEAADARHLSSLYLRQLADSRYLGGTLSFGGAWARCDYNVSLEGEGADCDLFGLYAVGNGQLGDFHLDIRHQQPGCSSRERFKGIAWGKGRAVFDGRVLVQPQAQRSDAMLKNDNLLLSREAEVDTKPQLEIYADDVKCGHGTTVGQIEPEQLFYLRSRGISLADAQRMLCEGFAGEVIDRVEPPAVSEQAYRQLAAVLAQGHQEV